MFMGLLFAGVFVASKFTVDFVEKQVGKAVGGTCEIEKFSFSIFSGNITLENVEIESAKDQNVSFSLGIKQVNGNIRIFGLLKGIDVNQMEVSGLSLKILLSTIDSPTIKKSLTNKKPLQTAKSKSWLKLNIKSFSLVDSSLRIVKNTGYSTKEFFLNKVNLHTKNLRYPISPATFKRELNFDFNSTVNLDEEGSLKLTVDPATDKDGIFLVCAANASNFNIAEFLDVFTDGKFQLTSGFLDAEVKVTIEDAKLNGDATISTKGVKVSRVGEDPNSFLSGIIDQNSELKVNVNIQGGYNSPQLVVKLDGLKYLGSDDSKIILSKIEASIDGGSFIKHKTVFLKEVLIDNAEMVFVRDSSKAVTIFESMSAFKNVSRNTDATVSMTPNDFVKNTPDSVLKKTLVVEKLRLKGTAKFEDYSVDEPPAIILFRNIELSCDNFNYPAGKNDFTKIVLATNVGDYNEGVLRLYGKIVPYFELVNFNLSLDVVDVDACYFRKFYQSKLNLNVDSARLYMKSHGVCQDNILVSKHYVQVKNLSVTPLEGSDNIYGIKQDTVIEFLKKNDDVLSFGFEINGDIKSSKFSFNSDLKDKLLNGFIKTLIRSPKALADMAISAGKELLSGNTLSDLLKGFSKGKDK